MVKTKWYAKIVTGLRRRGLVAGRLALARARGEPYIGKDWNSPPYFDDSWVHLDDNDQKCSHRLNMVLRHKIGVQWTPNGYPGVRCDEGCWVNMLKILCYNFIWDDGYDIRPDRTNDDVLYSKGCPSLFGLSTRPGRRRDSR